MFLFFYLFGSLLVVSSIVVITSKNPVYSVLGLIFAFCNASGLMVLLGGEFLAMMLIVVYVGAVAVLFLFTVMMLDIHFAELKGRLRDNLSLSIFLAILMLAEFAFIILSATNRMQIYADGDTPIVFGISNTHSIGMSLYTDYLLPFQMAGLILFAAMIACISLAFKRKTAVKRQNKAEQLKKNKRNSVKLIAPELNQGVKDIKYE